jgi:glycosyltransferase involved in cell wall biosynthesis
MYNILQISNELGIGGTERVLCSICRHMNYGLFRHFVAGFFRGGERCAEICRYSKTFILAGSLNKLKDCIVNNGIDVVIMHRAGKAEKHWSNILRICKENNVKVILEFNVFGLVDVSDEDKFIDWHLHVSKTSYYNFQKRAARLNYNGVATHRVIYNPVEIKNFRKLRLNKDDAADVRKGLGLSDEDFVLLRVGRPDVRKWSDIFL